MSLHYVLNSPLDKLELVILLLNKVSCKYRNLSQSSPGQLILALSEENIHIGADTCDLETKK